MEGPLAQQQPDGGGGGGGGAGEEKGDETSYRVQHLQYLNLCEWPQSRYTDRDYGPVKPGYSFYSWLFQGSSPLRLPIAETIVVEKDVVRVLRSTGPNGTIAKEVVRFAQQADRDEFVYRSLESFVVNSKPLGQFPQSEMLQDRFVAVCKRPVYRPDAAVSNNCELLIPQYFQAQLVEALDSKSQSLVLQKFIKNRGSKPGIYRVFWKADACAAAPSGTVTGHFITRAKEEFTAFERENSGMPDGASGGLSSFKRAALSTEISQLNRTFIDEMRSKLDMSMSERAEAVRLGQAAHRHAEFANLVSLSVASTGGQPARDISASVVDSVATSRVLRKALEEVRGYIEALVLWLQNLLSKQESLVFHISDLVCDFIRDDDGKWWFVQLKGFDISAASIARCNTWCRYMQDGNVRELLRRRHHEREITRKKLEAERGLKCKTCGLNFQDEQTIDIETGIDLLLAAGEGEGEGGGRGPKTSSPGSTEKRPRTAPSPSSSGRPRVTKRNVPAFGYELSRKMACRLSEIYRDNDFWLTKFSRAVLASKSSVPDARTVADKLARDENVLEMPPLACCFFCQQIADEYAKVSGLCRLLSERLRLGNAALANDADGVGGDAGGKSTASLRALPGLHVRDHDGGFTLDPWRSQHFKRGTHQFRLFVLVHHLSQTRLDGGGGKHHLKDGLGVVSYSLGQSQCRLPFRCALEGGEDDDQPLVPVRQSRIHYLCGTTADVKSFFQSKALRFEIAVSQRDANGLPVNSGGGLVDSDRLGSFSVPLSGLRLTNSAALRDGSEKVDLLVPVHLGALGPAVVVRLSLAVIRDDLLPWQLTEVSSLRKEGDVFWPAADYWELSAMPDTWTEMMAVGSGGGGAAAASAARDAHRRRSPHTDAERRHAEDQPQVLDSATQAFSQRHDAMEQLLRASRSVRALVVGQVDSDDDDDDGGAGDEEKNDLTRGNDGARRDSLAKKASGAELLDRKRRSSDAGLSDVMTLARTTFARMVEEGVAVLRPQNEADSRAGTSGGGSGGVSKKGGKSGSDDDDDDDDEDEGEDRFGDDVEKPKPGNKAGGGSDDEQSSHSSDNSDEYDFDDKLKIYSFVAAVFADLKAAEEAAFERVHNADGEVELVPRQGAAGRLSEGHILMRMALEQLLLEEHLPEGVTWTDFQALVSECIAWAKTQRSKIRIAKKGPASGAAGAAASVALPASGGDGGGGGGAVIAAAAKPPTATTKAWIKAAEARLRDWRQSFRDTALDVGCSRSEVILRERRGLISLGAVAGAIKVQSRSSFGGGGGGGSDASSSSPQLSSSPPSTNSSASTLVPAPAPAAAPSNRVNFALQPSSVQRKTRRLMFAMAIFEIASGGGDSLSLDELESFATRERSRLLRFISLVKEGEVAFPHFEQNYRAEQLGEMPFSVTRALLCCHLLSSSAQLHSLREAAAAAASEGDSAAGGQNLVSLAGFLRATEEACFNVTNHLNENVLLGEVDQAVTELQLLATEKQMALMNSDSHAARRRGSNFTLGLTDYLDDRGGEGRRLTVDASSIASRRRSSALSELAQQKAKGGKAGTDKDVPPFVYCFCDMHGVEKFFLADFCCCRCEKEWWAAAGVR